MGTTLYYITQNLGYISTVPKPSDEDHCNADVAAGESGIQVQQKCKAPKSKMNKCGNKVTIFTTTFIINI